MNVFQGNKNRSQMRPVFYVLKA